MKYLLALAGLLLGAASLKATSVVVFRTPDRIVMASDSMEQRRSGDERDHRRMCKIRAGGRWYSTLSG